jgi:hypothetical protein
LLDTVAGSTAQASSTPAGRDIQHTMAFAPEIDQASQGVIQRVLAANPILSAMWRWIQQHTTVHLDIQATAGNPSVTAAIGDTHVSLKLPPQGAHEQGGATLLGSISHELTLHLLPWARHAMTVEAMAAPDAMTADVKTVLGPIAANQETLKKHITADITNKATPAPGNHSDLGLWASHMRTVVKIADGEADQNQAALIVTTAMSKMALSMAVTGNEAEAIDRGPEAFKDFNAALQLVFAYQSKITDPAAKTSFVNSVESILNRATAYEDLLKGKRSG